MDSTTRKGFQLLEVLARSEDARGVSDLAREMGLNRSNVQRILATLCDLDYAAKDPQSNRYVPTLRLWEMGIPVLARNRIVRAARAHLVAVHGQTDESTVLCLRDADEIVYVTKLESRSPIRMSCTVGTRLPLHATATGRVIAAYLDEDERTALCRRLAAAHGAPDLALRLPAIRERGFEVSLGSYRVGINSLAVPVLGTGGLVNASIALTGPAERLTMETMMAHRPALLDAAARISESLGYAGELV